MRRRRPAELRNNSIYLSPFWRKCKFCGHWFACWCCIIYIYICIYLDMFIYRRIVFYPYLHLDHCRWLPIVIQLLVTLNSPFWVTWRASNLPSSRQSARFLVFARIQGWRPVAFMDVASEALLIVPQCLFKGWALTKASVPVPYESEVGDFYKDMA